MRLFLSTIAILVLVTGCQSLPRPGLSLRDAEVVEGPVLVERGGHFYLRYRRAPATKEIWRCYAVVDFKKTRSAVYYYFVDMLSMDEYGNVVEIPMAYGGNEELAKAGQVFWLDPGGKTFQIPIQKE